MSFPACMKVKLECRSYSARSNAEAAEFVELDSCFSEQALGKSSRACEARIYTRQPACLPFMLHIMLEVSEKAITKRQSPQPAQLHKRSVQRLGISPQACCHDI